MSEITFKPIIITKNLTSCLKDRTRDIMVQRYGLGDSASKKTLEAIGQKYGITRERIRQIENFALHSIKESESFKEHKNIFDELKYIIEKKGWIVSEREILDQVAEDLRSRNHIFFLLVLGDDFIKFKEDEEFHHRWTIDQERAEKVHEALRRLHGEIKEDDLISEKEIVAFLKKHADDVVKEKVQEEIIRSWLNISKIIRSNALGEWGRVSSPHIKPRGVRDLAFLVLRKHGSPMHFQEVADRISKYFSRPAHSATVHNELIKDNRFVLVGRGLYALKEWGYKPGTVKDIIKNIIKEKGPSSKEEIIKTLMKERYVKENTVLVNLQNQNYFRKNKEGKYVIS